MREEYFEKENYFLPWNNLTQAQKDEQRQWQKELKERLGFSVGENCTISPEAHIYEVKKAVFGNKIKIGSHAILRRVEIEAGDDITVNSYAVLHGKITMGSCIGIAPGAKLFGENHVIERTDIPFREQGNSQKGIVIGSDVWIGADAKILDGVTVGSHTVIAAGAVVTNDVADYCIVGGNPARVIRNRLAALKDSREIKDIITEFGKKAKEQWQEVLASCVTNGEYRDKKDAPPTVRAFCDAAEIAAMFDSTVPLMPREEYVQKLHSMEKDCHDYERVLSVPYALIAMGEKPDAMFDYVNKTDVWEFLSEQKWSTDPWDGGHNADILATAMYMNKKFFGQRVDECALFGWLNANVLPQTGMWGKDKNGDFLLPVNGWYRAVRGSYGQFNVPFPHCEKVIDTVLKHKDKYPKGNACYTLDIAYPLRFCSEQTSYRITQGQAWALEQIRRIAASWRPGFSFELEGGQVGLQGSEMWLSIMYDLCKYIGNEHLLGYRPKGVHKID